MRNSRLSGEFKSTSDGMTMCSYTNQKTTLIHLFRFRPNIVFEGGGPFAEDQWEEIRIGSPDGPTITLVSKCVRCLVSKDVEAMNIAQDIECCTAS